MTTRRQFLRAAGGAALALPFLPSVARAADVPALLVYYLPNGRRREWWVPSASGGGLTFPGPAAALQPFAHRALSLVDLNNTAAVASPGAAHAMGTGTILTGKTIPTVAGGQVHNDISVDQLIAREVDFGTRFGSLQWSAGEPGVCDVGGSACAYTQSLSWSGPRQPLLPTIHPSAAFTRLFGDGAVDGRTGRAAEIRRGSVGSVLDALRSDSARFASTLSAEDRETFQQYEASLRELETGLAPPATSCGSDALVPSAQSYPDRVVAFHELIRLALQCGQTQVITFMIEFGLSLRSHEFLSAPGGHHVLSHDLSPSGLDRLQRVESWHATMIADLLGRLDGTPSGSGGSLLDDTLVLVLPSMGDGYNHDHQRVCPLLFGAQRFVGTTGRQIATGGAPLANLHVTLMRLFGVGGSFGATGAVFGDDGTDALSGVLV
ncbi:MAG: DUF1552 domain-containing protein [Deltaproteobacteria bacterium]|nr:DUF1552 domain-containing protein [Deltaproteobacteria bacterium]